MAPFTLLIYLDISLSQLPAKPIEALSLGARARADLRPFAFFRLAGWPTFLQLQLPLEQSAPVNGKQAYFLACRRLHQRPQPVGGMERPVGQTPACFHLQRLLSREPNKLGLSISISLGRSHLPLAVRFGLTTSVCELPKVVRIYCRFLNDNNAPSGTFSRLADCRLPAASAAAGAVDSTQRRSWLSKNKTDDALGRGSFG